MRVSKLLRPKPVRVFVFMLIVNFAIMVTKSQARQIDESRAEEIEKIANETETKEGMVTIFVKVQTEDGGVPTKLKSNTNVDYGSDGTSSSSISQGHDPRLVGFEVKTRSGLINMIVRANGYAPFPAFVDQKVKAGAEIKKEITLKHGKSLKIRVFDDKGNPVESASFSLGYRVSDNSTSILQNGEKTDADGRATLKHLEPTILKYVSISKTGYSPTKVSKDLFQPGEIRVEMKPNKVTQGTVSDPLGKPVSGAMVYNFAQFENPYSVFLRSNQRPKPIAISEKDGSFSTDKLSGNQIVLFVETSEFQGFVLDVQAGDSLKLNLKKPRSIKVAFDGVPDKLRQNWLGSSDAPQITAKQIIGHQVVKLPVKIIESDNKLAASISNVHTGFLTISHSKHGRLLDQNPKPDLKEIKVDASHLKAIKKTIKFTFKHGNGQTKPKGTLRVREPAKGGEGGSWGIAKKVKIVNGVANAEVSSDKVLLSSEGLMGFVLKDDREYLGKSFGVKDNTIVEVEPAGAIRGTVFDANGKPTPTKIQCSYKAKDNPFTKNLEIFSNAEGEFLITPIPFGAKAKLRIAKFGQSKTTELTLDQSEPIPTVELKLLPTGKATALVRNQSGEAATNVRVSLTEKTKYGSHSMTRTTDNSGTVEFNSIPISAENFYISIDPVTDFQTPESQKVKVGDSLTFKLMPGHRLNGRVVDPSGKPVPELVVRAYFDGKSIQADKLTDKDGKFHFTRLPKKEVKLQARHRWERISTDKSKAVMPDKAEPVVLTTQSAKK